MEEFKTVKNNVKSENLKDIVKELERYNYVIIFGYNYDDDNEESQYEESIAERTKMRRQNKETDKKDASRTFASPDRELLPHQILTAMIQINLQKCIIHLVVRLLIMKGLKKYKKKAMIKKVMMVLDMINMGLMKMGLIKMGLIKIGLMKMGMINGGLIKMGLMKMGMINGGLIKIEKRQKI